MRRGGERGQFEGIAWWTHGVFGPGLRCPPWPRSYERQLSGVKACPASLRPHAATLLRSKHAQLDCSGTVLFCVIRGQRADGDFIDRAVTRVLVSQMSRLPIEHFRPALVGDSRPSDERRLHQVALTLELLAPCDRNNVIILLSIGK